MRVTGQSGQTGAGEMDMERMLREYGDGLLRMCYLYLKDRSLAEDALQETMLRAYQARASFEGRASEKTYLTAIAANVCRNMLKSAWLRRFAGSKPAGVPARSGQPRGRGFYGDARGNGPARQAQGGGGAVLLPGNEAARDRPGPGYIGFHRFRPAGKGKKAAARPAEGVVFR